MKKRSIALLIAAVLLVSLLTVAAFADDHVHSAEEISALAHTCTTDGNVHCWYCAGCETYFADAGCTTPLTAADILDPAPGHTWSDWESDGAGHHARHCTVCTSGQESENCADTDSDNLCDECGYRLAKSDTVLQVTDYSDPDNGSFYVVGESVEVTLQLTDDSTDNALAGKDIYQGSSKVGTTGSDGKVKINLTFASNGTLSYNFAFKGDDDFKASDAGEDFEVFALITKWDTKVTEPKVGAKPGTATVTTTPSNAKYTVSTQWYESPSGKSGTWVPMESTSTFKAGFFYGHDVSLMLDAPADGAALTAPYAYAFSDDVADTAATFTIGSKKYNASYEEYNSTSGSVFVDAYMGYDWELPYTLTPEEGKWAKTSTTTYTLNCDGNKANFAGVKVDGTVIASSNYTVSGNETKTTVVLSNAYLKTLAVKKHTVAFVYNIPDGSEPQGGSISPNATAIRPLAVSSKATTGPDNESTTKDSKVASLIVTSTPNDGDNSHPGMWIALAGASCCAVAAVAVTGKKKKAE